MKEREQAGRDGSKVSGGGGAPRDRGMEETGGWQASSTRTCCFSTARGPSRYYECFAPSLWGP